MVTSWHTRVSVYSTQLDYDYGHYRALVIITFIHFILKLNAQLVPAIVSPIRTSYQLIARCMRAASFVRSLPMRRTSSAGSGPRVNKYSLW